MNAKKIYTILKIAVRLLAGGAAQGRFIEIRLAFNKATRQAFFLGKLDTFMRTRKILICVCVCVFSCCTTT